MIFIQLVFGCLNKMLFIRIMLCEETIDRVVTLKSTQNDKRKHSVYFYAADQSFIYLFIYLSAGGSEQMLIEVT